MLTLVLALIDRPQKLDNIVTETQSLMDEMGQLEEQFSDSLNEMKENLSEATTDMSSKTDPPSWLSLCVQEMPLVCMVVGSAAFGPPLVTLPTCVH